MLKDYSNFGFVNIRCEDKTQRVKHVFNSVSSYYDLMNDFMSFGLHRLWKRKIIYFLNPKPGEHLVDVAGGSGDVSLEYLKFTNQFTPKSRVIIVDINYKMLTYSFKYKCNNFERLSMVNSDAVFLPIETKSINFYTISFGLRNITHINRALKEAYRILKPKSKFICLEFSKPSFLFQKTYLFYLERILPDIGRLITKDFFSYRYLSESIIKFLSSDDIIHKIKLSGFKKCNYYSINGGLVGLYIGFKI